MHNSCIEVYVLTINLFIRLLTGNNIFLSFIIGFQDYMFLLSEPVFA